MRLSAVTSSVRERAKRGTESERVGGLPLYTIALAKERARDRERERAWLKYCTLARQRVDLGLVPGGAFLFLLSGA